MLDFSIFTKKNNSRCGDNFLTVRFDPYRSLHDTDLFSLKPKVWNPVQNVGTRYWFENGGEVGSVFSLRYLKYLNLSQKSYIHT